MPTATFEFYKDETVETAAIADADVKAFVAKLLERLSEAAPKYPAASMVRTWGYYADVKYVIKLYPEHTRA